MELISKGNCIFSLVILCLCVRLFGAAVDFYCPRSCDCDSSVEESGVKDIKCFLEKVESLDFDYFKQMNEKYLLSLFCDYRTVAGELHNAMFTSLHSCLRISFHQCRFSYINSHVFEGMTSLRHLEVYKASNLHMNPLVFRDIPNMMTIKIVESQLLVLPNLCELEHLKEVNLTGNEITSLNDVGLVCHNADHHFHLRLADLSSNEITKLCANSEFVNENAVLNSLASVKSLSLSGNMINTTEDSCFSAFKSLHVVDLSRNALGEMPEKLLRNNKNIQHLDLSNNEIGTIGSSVFDNSSRILTLRIDNTKIGDRAWKSLKPLRLLKQLHMRNSMLQTIDKNVLSKLVELSVLDLSSNDITLVPSGTFDKLFGLTYLNLSRNDLTELDQQTFHSLVFLEILDLSQNHINSLHYEALTSLVSLLYLNLSSNLLGNISDMSQLTSLTVLDLSSNLITDLGQLPFVGLTNLKFVSLAKNYLHSIQEDLFKPSRKIVEINISFNLIGSIHPLAFDKLPNLRKLNLNHNRILRIGRLLAPVTGLTELHFSDNLLNESIQRHTFPEKTEEIDLSFNRIPNVRQYAFEGLAHLRKVNLRFNKITTLSERSLAVSTGREVKTNIYLGGNEFSCDCNLQWLKRWVSDQPAQGPYIPDINETDCSSTYNAPPGPFTQVATDSFLCRYEQMCPLQCACCDYTMCSCRATCPKACKCYNSADLTSQHYVLCPDKNITEIEESIPKFATLLDLSHNNISDIQAHSFIGMSNLRTLFLNHNFITLLQNQCFKGLQKVTSLHLNNNEITNITKGVFLGLETLENLYLEDNAIEYLADDALAGIRALRILNLSGNRLRVFDGYLSHLVFTVTSLSLWDNPWHCDCIFYYAATHRMSAFVSEKTSVLTQEVSCIVSNQGHPTVMNVLTYGPKCKRSDYDSDVYAEDIVNGKDVTYLNNDTHSKESGPDKASPAKVGNEGDDKRLTVFLPVILASTLVFVLVVVALCRKELMKMWLCAKYNCANGRRENLDERPYDAFLSYHPRDDIYVTRELAIRLERGNPKFRLKLQNRDRPSGTPVSDFIVHCIPKSHRVIMVISNDYLDDPSCCDFVTTCIHNDIAERLILVILGKINSGLLDPKIKSYLKSSRCIRYGDPWFWEKLYYCMPAPRQFVDQTMVEPYASSDLFKLSSAMMDNQAYEEPMSVTTRPLPSISEYVPDTNTVYTGEVRYGGSQHSSNIYEEIRDPPYSEAESCIVKPTIHLQDSKC